MIITPACGSGHGIRRDPTYVMRLHRDNSDSLNDVNDIGSSGCTAARRNRAEGKGDEGENVLRKGIAQKRKIEPY